MFNRRTTEHWWKIIPLNIGDLENAIVESDMLQPWQVDMLRFCILKAYRLADMTPDTIVSIQSIGSLLTRLYTDFYRWSKNRLSAIRRCRSNTNGSQYSFQHKPCGKLSLYLGRVEK